MGYWNRIRYPEYRPEMGANSVSMPVLSPSEVKSESDRRAIAAAVLMFKAKHPKADGPALIEFNPVTRHIVVEIASLGLREVFTFSDLGIK
jgi:hypothetical protein